MTHSLQTPVTPDDLAEAISDATFVSSATLSDNARALVAIETAKVTPTPEAHDAADALIIACEDLAAKISACGPTLPEAAEDETAEARETACKKLDAFMHQLSKCPENELAKLLAPAMEKAAS